MKLAIPTYKRLEVANTTQHSRASVYLRERPAASWSPMTPLRARQLWHPTFNRDVSKTVITYKVDGTEYWS